MFMMAQSSASENDALMLYRQVLAQPGSQTALQMRSQLDVAIKGPWLDHHPFLVSAVGLKYRQPAGLEIAASIVGGGATGSLG